MLVLALAGNAWSQTLFSDPFDGSAIDSSKWDVLSPYSDSTVSVQNGSLRSVCRGTIVTKDTFTLTSYSPLVVSGSFQLANEFSVFEVWLRSDGVIIPTNPYGWVGGVGISFWSGWNSWSSPGLKIGLSDMSPNLFDDGIRFNPNQIYSFRITDTGTSLSVEVDGTQRASITTSFTKGNKVAFNGRQNLDGQLGQIDIFDTQIVPEPSSLSLLLVGGALLMAGRRRK